MITFLVLWNLNQFTVDIDKIFLIILNNTHLFNNWRNG